MPLCPEGYVDLGPIALGATAIVRRVTRGATLFALKRLHPHLLPHPEARLLFADETLLGPHLDHPCLARLLDHGSDDMGPYQLQEYVPGPTLSALLEASPVLTVPIAARIAADVARGLAFAHSLVGDDGLPLDVIHRDLNPSNIIVSVTGVSRVIDFGVACFRGALSPRSVVRGTPAYLSPEQARGEALTRASDLFAVGSIFYEMLTGSRAFPGSEHIALASIGANTTPKAPANIPPSAAAVLRALFAPLAKRAKEATHVAAALQSIAAPPEEVVALLRRLVRR